MGSMSRSESIGYDHHLHPSIDPSTASSSSSWTKSSSSYLPSYVSLPRRAKIKSLLHMHPTTLSTSTETSTATTTSSGSDDVKEFSTRVTTANIMTSDCDSKKTSQTSFTKRFASSDDTQLPSTTQVNLRTDALKSSVLKSFDKILYYDDDRSRVWNSLSTEASSGPSSLLELPSLTSLPKTPMSLTCKQQTSVISDSEKNVPEIDPPDQYKSLEAVPSTSSLSQSLEKFKVSTSAEGRSSSSTSLLNQFKAWTSDRKIIRGRLKKIKNKYKYTLGKLDSSTTSSSSSKSLSSEVASSASCSTDSCGNFKETLVYPNKAQSISSSSANKVCEPTSSSSSSLTQQQKQHHPHVKRTNSSVSSASSSPSVGASSSWKRLSILTFPSFSGHPFRRNHSTTTSSSSNKDSKIREDLSEENSSSQASSSTRDSGISPDSSSQLDSEVEHMDPSWPLTLTSTPNTVSQIQVVTLSSSASPSPPPIPLNCPLKYDHEEDIAKGFAKTHLNSIKNACPENESETASSPAVPLPNTTSSSSTVTTSTLEISLTKDSRGELGIYVTGKLDTVTDTMRYIIADFESDGPASRNGLLKRGDEVLAVNFKSLRGLSLENALKLLRTNDTTVHLLVSRQKETGILNASETEGNSPLSLDSLTITSSSNVSCSSPEKSVGNQLPLLVSPNPVTFALSSQLKAVEEQIHSGLHSQELHSNNVEKKRTDLGQNQGMKSELKDHKTRDQEADLMSGFFTTPRKASRHKNNQILTHGAAFFEKGPGKKPLGFSIIGGVDCGQNNVGIFVKTIYPKGQSFEMDCLKEGDEILSVNGQSVDGKTHDEVLALFKKVKVGTICVEFIRQPKRDRSQEKRSPGFQSCSQLDLIK